MIVSLGMRASRVYLADNGDESRRMNKTSLNTSLIRGRNEERGKRRGAGSFKEYQLDIVAYTDITVTVTIIIIL